ncbi:AAA family ATPase [Burkholderia cenocepacia]|jgi:putative ATP-dependent endonuclease of the OLD family|uniref:ATP-dependent nuclease n=1 Tax=Burkholderia cenocepacia TaxID=95486 RepID=UPI00078C15BC|nr:AAA family ATPase [Burkholderia cenocepacia]AMU14361.1 ATP-dependent endonuclease [Burkholderia cenocepacia]MCW3589078.1 AAA family ATPase [Burkholderia cenocepacia]MCW3634106.1 AAA family ATPase [Burkholderia cenocepacia]MCW3649027.1 AAA family ATPase [Burkholderia cenocepacia]MCW5185206.1 AAA family ATPase [Burkholderia cenocepacia]
MKLQKVVIRNFRRLENVMIDVEEKETLFVGPNNSGKTSATAIFRAFLGGREFKIHDFSVSRVADFDRFAETGDVDNLPEIGLDLWFEIDPNTVAFGRVFTLLPNLSDFTQVGFRLQFGIADAKKLREEYFVAYPAGDNGRRARSLFQYLATDTNLHRHATTRYASLETVAGDGGETAIVATPLEPDEGKRLVRQLVRVEFVDAQRNINDDDNSRSNRLSAAFASFYRKNLDQAEYAAEAHRVIDQNNADLTRHYEKQFAPLMDLIRGLGVPSVNDRELKIISSLSPESALRGNTELLYVDPGRQHELPELYNGLGFKNLIYMAIQARHFHSQWLATADSRPLCLLIFIEEPEVHLHAQVQQSFITNIWSVIEASAKAADQPTLMPQLVVTTHSSHILDAVDFEKVRYFQRCHLGGEAAQDGIRNASDVRSLRAFQPEADVVDGVTISPENTLSFLKRYLRLTHCDLFFADAAILVEGAAEKLLLPSMIEISAVRLRTCYLTILEVGGAYAHRFEGLLEFLRIPYLVVTDLDSVEPTGYPTTCRADVAGARTSNASLKKLCGKGTVAELIAMSPADKIHTSKDRCIAFEVGVQVSEGGTQLEMIPRTFEEAIAYENFELLRTETLSIGKDIPSNLSEAYTVIYERISSKEFKKTEFAMDLLATKSRWTVPAYIAEGLRWLELRLRGEQAPQHPQEATPEAGVTT